MSRELPEWIGRADNSPVPPRVRLRVFEAYGGRCYLSGRKIMAGDKWEIEHKLAIILGGSNRESNLAPALVGPHKLKTRVDVALKAKITRTRQKHLGIKTGQGFRKHESLVRGVDGIVRERRT